MNVNERATERNLKEMALALAAGCVRNTVIEDYHAAGKLSDPEMAAFNREVADKLYTALRYVASELEPEGDRAAFARMLRAMHPHSWDEPVLDGEFLAGIEIVRRKRDRQGLA